MCWKIRTLILNVFLMMHLASGDDLHFLKNDVMTLAGWGSAATFQTINYQPVCGVLLSGFTNPINQVSCKTAMTYYKESSKTYATYNDLGVETNNVPGDGETFCLCFSLKDTGGKMGDFCIAISTDGQQVVWWTLAYDSRAGGQFMPAGKKALPACPDVDLAAISSSLLAMAGISSSTIQKTSGSTKTSLSDSSVESHTASQTSPSTTITQAPSNTTPDVKTTATTETTIFALLSTTADLSPLNPLVSNSQPPSSSQGLLVGDKIALGVGLGIGIPGLILSYLTWRNKQSHTADSQLS